MQSIVEFCTGRQITTGLFYRSQRKVLNRLIGSQTGSNEGRWICFAELPPVEAFPMPQLSSASEPQTEISKEAVATLRIRGTEIEIYARADAVLVETLCRGDSCSVTSMELYLAVGYTDLRKGIDGRAALVQQQFELDPFTNTLFLFCGRRRDRMKAFYLGKDGVLLLYKRLEEDASIGQEAGIWVHYRTRHTIYQSVYQSVRLLDGYQKRFCSVLVNLLVGFFSGLAART